MCGLVCLVGTKGVLYGVWMFIFLQCFAAFIWLIFKCQICLKKSHFSHSRIILQSWWHYHPSIQPFHPSIKTCVFSLTLPLIDIHDHSVDSVWRTSQTCYQIMSAQTHMKSHMMCVKINSTAVSKSDHNAFDGWMDEWWCYRLLYSPR